MKRTVYSLTLCCFLTFSALLLQVYAADDQPEPNLAADAARAEKDPPVIPHAVKDDADGASCNQCHVGSLKLAPHPDRLNCTQCHVPGDAKKSSGKGGKKATRK